MLVQFNIVIHYYLVAQSLALPIPIYDYFTMVPLAIFVMMIPVSINAIGIRESIFAFFLGSYGVPVADAIAFAWLIYGFILLQGILGGIVYALCSGERPDINPPLTPED